MIHAINAGCLLTRHQLTDVYDRRVVDMQNYARLLRILSYPQLLGLKF